MNISGMGHSLNFGQVKRSAAKAAIEEAKYNVDELYEIEKNIKKQKDNHAYPISVDPSLPYKHYIISLGEGRRTVCRSFNDACKTASDFKAHDDKANGLPTNKDNKPKFDKMATKILENCEE